MADKPLFHVEKEVAVGHGGLTRHLTVVESIRDYGRLPRKGMSKHSKKRVCKTLSSEGIIKKIAYGVWEVDWNKWLIFSHKKEVAVGDDGTPISPATFHVQRRGVRGHGFQWVLKVPDLKNWDRRQNYLMAKGISFKPSGSFRKAESILVQQFRVWLCQKSIVIYFPESLDVLENSALKCKEAAFFKLLEIIQALEKILETSFRIVGKYQVRMVKQHYADPNNELAKKYESEGKKLHVIGEDGKTWLLIDNSQGVPELECVHSQDAVKDMDDVVKTFFNDLRLHPVMPGEILQMQGSILADHLALSVVVKQLVEAMRILSERL